MGKITSLFKLYNRIYFKKTWLVLLSVVFPIVFFVFFSFIFTNYDDVTKIPLAIIDQDHSEISQDLMDGLSSNDSIKVITSDYDEAVKLLKRNRLEAIFIILEGYEKKIMTSDYNEAIEVIYLDKSTIGPAIGDIIISEVIIPLSIYKAANQSVTYEKQYDYDGLFDKTKSKGLELYEDSKFEMEVISTVMTPSVQRDEDITIDDLFRSNITFGFIIIVFSLIIMFSNSFYIENTTPVARLITTGYKAHQIYIARSLQVIVSGLPVIVSQLLVVYYGMAIKSITSILLIAFVYLLHLVLLSQLVVLFTSAFKDKMKYQSIVAPLIFTIGLLGGAFWSVEFLAVNLKWITTLSPLYFTLVLLRNIQIHGPLHSYFIGYCIFLVIILIITQVIFKINYERNRHF